MGSNPTALYGMALPRKANPNWPSSFCLMHYSMMVVNLQADSIFEENANKPLWQLIRWRDHLAAYADQVIYQCLLPERA